MRHGEQARVGSREGYIVVQRAAAGETIRAESFEAVELRVGVLFGDDEDD